MTALTVVLAGTVLAFTMAIDEDPPAKNAPTTDFVFEFDENAGGPDAVTVRHRKGDSVEPTRLSVSLQGATCDGGSDDPNRLLNAADDWGLTDELTAGKSILLSDPLPAGGTTTLCSGGTLELDAATVRLVWEGGEETTVSLETWEVPG